MQLVDLTAGAVGQLEHLRGWRAAKGLSQQALADRAGSTQAAISQLERGRRVPTLRTLGRLAAALELEPAQLLGPVAATSLTRQVADRVARQVVRGEGAQSAAEARMARDIGALCSQKLRAHRAPGSRRYAASRWAVARRSAHVARTYGTQAVRQVLHRIDTLLAMRVWN